MDNSIINQSNFENNLKKLIIIPKKTKLLVATSGGADSLCLSILLKNFAKKINTEVLSLIVDHKLRPESTEEAHFVSCLLAKHNIQSTILTRKNTPITTGIQNKAREDRYLLLTNYAKEHNCPYLFLAHHLDDQLETIALREESGKNLVGSSGMSAKVVQKEVTLVRPFLIYTKEQIVKTLKTFTNEWVEDPSNQNEKYARVRHRKKLKDINDEDKKSLIVQCQNNAINRQGIEKDSISFFSKGILINKFGLIKLNLILLNKYSENVKIFVLRKLIKFANGKPYEVKIEQIRTFLVELKNKQSFKFSLGNCLLKVKKDVIFIYKNRGQSNRIKVEKFLTYWDNRFLFFNKNQEKEAFIDKINKENYFIKINNKEFKKYFQNYGLDGDFIKGLPLLIEKEEDLENYKNFIYKPKKPIFMNFFEIIC